MDGECEDEKSAQISAVCRFCTMCLWGKQVNAADTSEVQVELTGVKDVKIYTDKGGQEISVVDDKFSALTWMIIITSAFGRMMTDF